MSECVFCEIVAKRAPAMIVDEWDDAIAIVPLNPVTEGHVLVIPRQHVKDATAFPDVTGLVMRRAGLFAADLGSCNIITSVGAEATQSVFHMHVHVVPRREGDGLALPWTDQIALQQMMAERISELEDKVTESALASIEARNPGIDMDEVREQFVRDRATWKMPLPYR